MKSETVEVFERVKTGSGWGNNSIYDEMPVSVFNVLVAPGACLDIKESKRPDGVEIAYTLYFPKTYTGDPSGKKIMVRNHPCKVVGHPDRYLDSPNEWSMAVEVESSDG